MKNPLIAVVLGFIPGCGHLYLQKMRGVVYLLVFSLIVFAFFIQMADNYHNGGELLFFFTCGVIVWLINMADLIAALFRGARLQAQADQATSATPGMNERQLQQNERFTTIFLSIIPGLGHFSMGLMQRGLTLLVGFFGMLTMILFVTFITGRPGFLVFLCLLPVIWLYTLFDAGQLIQRKQRGEEVSDRIFLDDFEELRLYGKKSKVFVALLSLFPGAGHLYLGLQKRGLQLMTAFLLSIYILDALRLSIFLFLIPIIWFFSVFDSLQLAGKQEKEPAEDVPFVQWLGNHQHWVGAGLVIFGLYFLFDQMVLPIIGETEYGQEIVKWVRDYMQIFIVSVLLIGGGIRLLIGNKRRS